MGDPKERLAAANAAISAAGMLIAAELATVEAFLAECERMESIGPILVPSLFMSAERRATEALLQPLYLAARDFHRVYAAQLQAAAAALEAVDG